MTRSAEQCHRLAFEANLLRKYFPSFSVYEPSGKTYIEGCIRTNGGWNFRLKIDVPESYPYSKPKMYVMEPTTLYKKGNASTINSLGSSHAFHTLGNGPDGVVCICHTAGWDSSRTFIQILKKGRLWCEAYEAHLRTGKDICEYLSA